MIDDDPEKVPLGLFGIEAFGLDCSGPEVNQQTTTERTAAGCKGLLRRRSRSSLEELDLIKIHLRIGPATTDAPGKHFEDQRKTIAL